MKSRRYSIPPVRRGRSFVRRRGAWGFAAVLALTVAGWYWPDSFEPARPISENTAAPSTAAQSRPAFYTLVGSVITVSDGDTVAFRSSNSNHRIRLDSIDAPEIGHGAKQPGQPFGRAARDYLANWLTGKSITAQCYGVDQYGLDLCDLLSAQGESANREMVRSGYAWAYTAARGKYLRDASLPALQEQARQARRGLWAQGSPIRPWQWRHDCWKQRQC